MRWRQVCGPVLASLVLAGLARGDVNPGDSAGGPTPNAVITAFINESNTAIVNINNNGMISNGPVTAIMAKDENGNTVPFFSLGGAFVRAGDVVLKEPAVDGGGNSDILRFHNPGGGAVGMPGYADWFTLYSDVEPNEANQSFADIGVPAVIAGANGGVFAPAVYINEVGPSDDVNWASYTAGKNTYNIISDSPEPSTLVLAGIGALAFLARGRLRRGRL